MRRPRTAGWCWTTARSEQWWTVARRCCLRGSWRCRASSRQASRSSWSPPVVTSSRGAWWRSRRASCRTCWAGPPGSSASSWASATTARWSTATTWCSSPTTASAYPAGMTTTDPAPASGAAVPDDVRDAVFAIARRARAAARELAGATRATKDAALHAMADALVAAAPEIVSANAVDLERAQANGVSAGLLDRLTLTVARVAGIADALREVASLPDPVGEVVRGSTLPNGLRLQQVRVPMGVVGMIYEARPNVTVDAAGLALKSGNAAILRGGSAASGSNSVIVRVLGEALTRVGLPADAVQSIDAYGRAGAVALMHARGLVDLLVPRGGADLIQTVVREASVPVVETGVGNCHVYLDASADRAMAVDIVMNSKTQRVGVCNAAETLLVHADAAARLLPDVLAALAGAGVRLHGDGRTGARGCRGAAGDRGGLGDRVPVDGPGGPRGRRPGGCDRAHPHLVDRAHRGDRDRGPGGVGPVRRGPGLGRDHGQCLDPVHRRWAVRPGGRDRHLDPEDARARPDGLGRADHHQVDRARRGPGPGLTRAVVGLAADHPFGASEAVRDALISPTVAPPPVPVPVPGVRHWTVRCAPAPAGREPPRRSTCTLPCWPPEGRSRRSSRSRRGRRRDRLRGAPGAAGGGVRVPERGEPELKRSTGGIDAEQTTGTRTTATEDRRRR